MSVMDKFLSAMKLNPEDEDDFDDGYYDEEDEEPIPAPRKTSAVKEPSYDDEPRVVKKPTSTGKVTQMRAISTPKKSMSGDGMQVCVFKPTSVEDGREITDTLLNNRTVVLNLEGLDVDVAQRIIDFTSGSCYAIRGTLQKISNYIFIVTPPSVDVSGDFQELLSGSFDVPIGGR